MLKVGYTYIDAGFNILQGFESRYILENLRHQYVANLALQLPYQFKASVGLRVFERMNQAETFGVCDIQLERPIHKKGSLFLQTTNLFNTPYREIGTVPMPGRWIRGGLRFQL
jgi:iron complex outermembrane receptor protein